MNMQELKELIDFLKENGVSEFESNENGKLIRLSLIPNKSIYQVGTENFKTEMMVENKSLGELPKQNHVANAEDFISVKSPIVGTFYSKSSPEAEPFVSLGTKVKKGQVLCILEAMKVMNEITSPVNGVIEEVCTQDGEIVEFDETIFKIKEN